MENYLDKLDDVAKTKYEAKTGFIGRQDPYMSVYVCKHDKRLHVVKSQVSCEFWLLVTKLYLV